MGGTTVDAEIVPIDDETAAPDLDDADRLHAAGLMDSVRDFVDQSISENTARAYRADWQHFTEWCRRHAVSPLPASSETVAAYISGLASGEAAADDTSYTASTISRRLTTIRVVHGARGAGDPTDTELVKKTWKGIRRDDEVDVDQNGRRALLTPHIRKMVDSLDDETIKGLRDCAMILLGFATGARRSELAGLDVDDLDFRAEGLVVHIRRSKADQEGRGRTPSIHYGGEYCPVSTVQRWLHTGDIDDGAVFRTVDRWGNLRDNRMSGRSINRIVKSAAESAGLNSDRIGAHSLRAGHVTQRKVAGDADGAIMDQTGHSSESTMRRYDRRAKQFRHDVCESLGL